MVSFELFRPLKDEREVRETEKLYSDAIAAAKEFIYIENQYLTSMAVARALQKSLQQEKGPEIVLVLPRKSSGWLEQSTMDAIRAHILNQLDQADRNNRLRVLYPASLTGKIPYMFMPKSWWSMTVCYWSARPI